MKIKKETFENKDGEKISAVLDLPVDQKPHNYAVFAHCFTCSKNLSAVKNISRALTSNGFGVLRFDFTGLGESEGDFSDTNFSSNVDDLINVTEQFGKKYAAPTLLIGHSLGGAAAIVAANSLPEIKAVATIAAPSNTEHVKKLLTSDIDEIKTKGEATVNLSGRKFKIKKQFIDDLDNNNIQKIVKKWGKSLLIFHSPLDEIVGIDNASEIFTAAKHPKSYISLHDADHLLSEPKDSLYVGETISMWASGYLDIPVPDKQKSNMQVVASLGEDKYTTQVQAGKHSFTADEPEKRGGNDYGPNPYDLLASAVATCKAMTMKMYAERKKWDLKEVDVHVTHSKDHAEDCNKCEDSSDAMIDKFDVLIDLEGDLNDTQRERLLEISAKCPVHRSLQNDIEFHSELSGDKE